MKWSIVIPTVGRSSLACLLWSLDRCGGPRPERVIVVDDRAEVGGELVGTAGWTTLRLTVVTSCGRGPAAARNAGWQTADPRTDWIVFLDDDVTVSSSWLTDLYADLSALDSKIAGSQGKVTVPLPTDRPPTDWERCTAGLAKAPWITADMAYRRSVLELLGGFDERFPSAFREDADLALRVMRRGYRLVAGDRRTCHPVRSARWYVSVQKQRGNADDALMRRLHGRGWQRRAGSPVGRRPIHLVTTGAAFMAVGACMLRARTTLTLAAAVWLGSTWQFFWARVSPGPHTAREATTMLVTSIVIPPSATWHWLWGCWRHRRAAEWTPPLRAVLLDRDGTLIRDVLFNGDPDQVQPLPRVAAALSRLRDAGFKLAVVSNQSGVARGLLTMKQVHAVNARVEELLGDFDDWQICPHEPDDGCGCRKPKPGLIKAAAAAVGVPATQCAVIGDIGSDVDAALAAGAGLAVLVPTAATRPAEIVAANTVCSTIDKAVDLILRRTFR